MGDKYRSRGSVPYLSDQPESSLFGPTWETRALPSTAPAAFVPGRTRFPTPNGSTPPGYEFAQDSTESLLQSIGTHLTRGDIPGLGRVLINAEAARQIAAESRKGDPEDFWGTVWRAIPGLPLAVDRTRFVNFMMGQGPAAKTGVDQLVAGQTKSPATDANATTGP